MLLANPIYDTIFKYLLEDVELARQLLSKIIGEEIVELTTRTTESTLQAKEYEILILRLDFKAVILTEEGIRKKILIELQKAHQLGDIMRFRKYLGNNYLQADIPDTETQKADGLPIITIYFLGFRLKNVDTPILKVNRIYLDLMTNEPMNTKEEFVEKLTHDSYVIQIPRLERQVRTELERVLSIFNQTYRTGDHKVLEIPNEEVENHELLEKLTLRLRKAVTDEDILRTLELEHDVIKVLDDAHREAQINKEQAQLAKEEATVAKEEATVAKEEATVAKRSNRSQRRQP